ncbi:MAG: hydrogenase iron-sulfur subunit [Candidatus Hodarchaeota archaeon]
MCNWCGYAGADLAGVSRFQYPPTVRIIRVMCSGRIQAPLILGAFNHGADGVLISGCHIGDCHYISGNEKAEKRVEQTRKLLDHLNIEPKRLRLEWISSAEGARFAEVVNDFTNQLVSLKPFNKQN